MPVSRSGDSVRLLLSPMDDGIAREASIVWLPGVFWRMLRLQPSLSPESGRVVAHLSPFIGMTLLHELLTITAAVRYDSCV